MKLAALATIGRTIEVDVLEGLEHVLDEPVSHVPELGRDPEPIVDLVEVGQLELDLADDLRQLVSERGDLTDEWRIVRLTAAPTTATAMA